MNNLHLKNMHAKQLLFELKKLLFSNHALWLIVALIVIKVASFQFSPVKSREYSELAYINYMQEFSGELTAENSEKIHAEGVRLNDILSKREEMEELYSFDKITLNEYSDYKNNLSNAEIQYSAFTAVMAKGEIFKDDFHDINPQFFNDLRAEDYLLSLDMDWLFFILCGVILAMTYSKDFSPNISPMLSSTKNGSSFLTLHRIFAGVILCMILSIAFSFVDILSFQFVSRTLSMPLHSIVAFANIPYNLSILGYLIICGMMRLAWTIPLVMLIHAIVMLVRSPFLTLFLTIVLIGVPHFFIGRFPTISLAFLSTHLSAKPVFMGKIMVSAIALFIWIAIMLVLNYVLGKRKKA